MCRDHPGIVLCVLATVAVIGRIAAIIIVFKLPKNQDVGGKVQYEMETITERTEIEQIIKVEEEEKLKRLRIFRCCARRAHAPRGIALHFGHARHGF